MKLKHLGLLIIPLIIILIAVFIFVIYWYIIKKFGNGYLKYTIEFIKDTTNKYNSINIDILQYKEIGLLIEDFTYERQSAFGDQLKLFIEFDFGSNEKYVSSYNLILNETKSNILDNSFVFTIDNDTNSIKYISNKYGPYNSSLNITLFIGIDTNTIDKFGDITNAHYNLLSKF